MSDDAGKARPGTWWVRTALARRRLPVAAVALLVAGLASAFPAAAAQSTVEVIQNPTFGSVLASGQGMAMYTYGRDHPGTSNCSGSCAAVWPPLVVGAGETPTAGPGVSGALATITRADGSRQVTYNGLPIYGYAGDTAAGQVNGDGVASFSVVRVAAGATSTTTTTTGGATGAATSTTTAPSASAGGGAGGTTPQAQTPASSSGGQGGVSGTAPSPSTAAAASAPGLAYTGAGDGLRYVAMLALLCCAAGTIGLVAGGRRARRSSATG